MITVATDWICSFPGQSLRFPGDGLSHSITLRPRSAEGAAASGHREGQGGRASGRGGGREGTTAVVGTSLFLIPCVTSVTALEF